MEEELLKGVEKEIQKHRPPAASSVGMDDGRFGDWKLEQLLGRNSIGELYLAKKAGANGTDDLAALRSFDSSLSRNPRLVKRFLQEAEKAASVAHPNIARVLDFGHGEGGSAYMARQYIAGQTLQNIVKHGLVSLDRGIEIALAVCSALAEADKNGLLHRNLNPSNIVIDDHGNIFVVDFGLSKAVPSEGRETMGLTNYQGRQDDSRYASPEQVRDERLDISSDLYSLGCIMHVLFTGEEIFADRTGFRLLQTKLQRLIEREPFENPNFSGPADERQQKIEKYMLVVQRSVSGDRKWRYCSPQELSEDLSRLASGKDLQPDTIKAVQDITKASVLDGGDGTHGAEVNAAGDKTAVDGKAGDTAPSAAYIKSIVGFIFVLIILLMAIGLGYAIGAKDWP